MNAEYLVKEKEKEEKRLKETEEGKPEKKRRKTTKKNKTPANTAGEYFFSVFYYVSIRIIIIYHSVRFYSSFEGEAIEKMLQEKKISSKINYEALKILNSTIHSSNNQQENNQESSTINTTLGLDDTRSFNKP